MLYNRATIVKEIFPILTKLFDVSVMKRGIRCKNCAQGEGLCALPRYFIQRKLRISLTASLFGSLGGWSAAGRQKDFVAKPHGATYPSPPALILLLSSLIYPRALFDLL
ncbi:MAG: hypothetical protein A2Y69_12120 [Candidatus Aminicenantes bacterium RBG_13_59_9]|nr:MAG: hypothetical protein A2Y69_12120 [Candidatus Aminicenantes bacterium RBG_13_59_9]